jgi:hypothetical protein
MAAFVHFSYRYLVPFSAILPIQVFVVWAATDHSFLRGRISHAVFGFLICAPMLYLVIQHATHLHPDRGGAVYEIPEYRFLRHQTLSDYEVYVFGQVDGQFIYDDFRILAPSPWLYHQFWSWYPRWDPDQQILESIGRDLLTHRTRYVLDLSAHGPFHFANPAASRWWKTFLQQHYQPLDLGGPPGITLWQLNP